MGALGAVFKARSALLKHEVAYVMGQMQDAQAVEFLVQVLKVRRAQQRTCVTVDARARSLPSMSQLMLSKLAVDVDAQAACSETPGIAARHFEHILCTSAFSNQPSTFGTAPALLQPNSRDVTEPERKLQHASKSMHQMHLKPQKFNAALACSNLACHLPACPTGR